MITKYIYLEIVTSHHFILGPTQPDPQIKIKAHLQIIQQLTLFPPNQSSLCSLPGEQRTKIGTPERRKASLRCAANPKEG